MEIYFTADTHFGHENIISYCNRPFRDILHQDRELIRRINERVKPEDILFILGDFCFNKSKEAPKGNVFLYYRQQIKCQDVIFIRGNHDRNNSCKTKIEKINVRIGGKLIGMIHNPAHIYYTIEDLFFVGHVHTAWKFKRLKTMFRFIDMINVGVDQWNFYPVTFNEINKHYSRWRKAQ